MTSTDKVNGLYPIMKKRHIWISAAAIAVIVFLFSQDALARLAWQKYHRPDAALMLNRH
ncbi:MAG: hypothetical protein HYT40_02860, partial [Candidatus Sungbacteria bacterium]|nr:hypothetical protein [Candidatus Sungbacteria bacterium]